MNEMVVKKTDNETLTPTQRWTGLLVVVGMLLLFGFFMLHQSMNTGFFTDKFGLLEKLCLYVPIFISLIDDGECEGNRIDRQKGP